MLKGTFAYMIFLCPNKPSLFSPLNKQADPKGQHSFILPHFVYMRRTLPPVMASNTVLGTLSSSENSLFIRLRRIFLSLYYYAINIVNILIREFALLLQSKTAPLLICETKPCTLVVIAAIAESHQNTCRH